LLRRVTAQAARIGGRADRFSHRLLMPSLRTLDLRMAACHRNAEEVAAFLRRHPAVVAVHRPAWEDVPWAVETHAGFAGLVSFTTKVPLPAAPVAGLSRPAWDSHGSAGARRLAQAGVTLGLVRVAVGHAPVAGLIARLRALLEQAVAA
jgi:cystathionine beta-lyase/cystathionine gamma-synthase